jgi:UDP-N-acetylglucosamine pyrophosphorylase
MKRVDQAILEHMIESEAEFLMEVTDKTKADVKVCHAGIKPTFAGA